MTVDDLPLAFRRFFIEELVRWLGGMDIDELDAQDSAFTVPRIYGQFGAQGLTGRQANLTARPGTTHLTVDLGGTRVAIGDHVKRPNKLIRKPRGGGVPVLPTPHQPTPYSPIGELLIPLQEGIYPSLLARPFGPADPERPETGYPHFVMPQVMSDLLRWTRLNDDGVLVPFTEYAMRQFDPNGVFGNYFTVPFWPYQSGYKSNPNSGRLEPYTLTIVSGVLFESDSPTLTSPDFFGGQHAATAPSFSGVYPEGGFVNGGAVEELYTGGVNYNVDFGNPRMLVGVFVPGARLDELELAPWVELSNPVMAGTAAPRVSTPLSFVSLLNIFNDSGEYVGDGDTPERTVYSLESIGELDGEQVIEQLYNEGEAWERVPPAPLMNIYTRFSIATDEGRGRLFFFDTGSVQVFQDNVIFTCTRPEGEMSEPVTRVYRFQNVRPAPEQADDPNFAGLYSIFSADIEGGDWPDGAYDVYSSNFRPLKLVDLTPTGSAGTDRSTMPSGVRLTFDAVKSVYPGYMVTLAETDTGYQVRYAPYYFAGLQHQTFFERLTYRTGEEDPETGEIIPVEPPEPNWVPLLQPQSFDFSTVPVFSGESVTLEAKGTFGPTGEELGNPFPGDQPLGPPGVTYLAGEVFGLEPANYSALDYLLRWSSISQSLRGPGVGLTPPDMKDELTDTQSTREYFELWHPKLCDTTPLEGVEPTAPAVTLHNPMALTYESSFFGLSWSQRWYSCNAFAVVEKEGEAEVTNTYAVVLLEDYSVSVAKNDTPVWSGVVWDFFPLASDQKLRLLDGRTWPDDFTQPVRPEYGWIAAFEQRERPYATLWPFMVRRRDTRDKVGQMFTANAALCPLTLYLESVSDAP